MPSALSLLRAALLFGVAVIGASGVVAEPLKTPCRVADEHLALNGSLDRAAARVSDGSVFTVLVVGSSSTAGVGATAPAKAYTERLESDLERRLAGVEVDVVARGVGGETAIGAERRLTNEIAATRPDLVVWQIGTNDAAQRVGLDTFRAVAARGLQDIAKAGVDVALLDPQFIPQADAAYAPYLMTIDALSAKFGVPVARRYAAMRALANGAPINLISRDGLHMNDAGHACVGAFLAEALGRKLAPLPAVAEAAKRT